MWVVGVPSSLLLLLFHRNISVNFNEFSSVNGVFINILMTQAQSILKEYLLLKPYINMNIYKPTYRFIYIHIYMFIYIYIKYIYHANWNDVLHGNELCV